MPDTTLTDSSATFHNDMVGSLCYMTSGDNAGDYREIAGVPATGQYPTLQVADGTFATTQADLGLAHTTAVSSLADLQAMNDAKGGNYYLTGNIDASDTATWNGGLGFVPVGEFGDYFTGTFDGCGYTISNLTMNRPDDSDVGLFGWLNGASIANVTLENPIITGEDYVGAVVGAMNNPGTKSSIIQNCHVIGGEIKAQGAAGSSFVGGLLGYSAGNASYSNYVYDCTSSCTIDYENHHSFDGILGTAEIGGLIGGIYSGNTVVNCRATGDVSAVDINGAGFSEVGGFTGVITGALIVVQDCAATGAVSGGDYTGGFSGNINKTPVTGAVTVQRCSARGAVTGAYTDSCRTGGFAGNINAWLTGANLTVQDCYAWGDVTVTASGAGVYGYGACFSPSCWRTTTIIDNCYAIGAVAVTADDPSYEIESAFQRITLPIATVTNSFWDTETSGVSSSHMGTGQTTAWMKTKTNYEDAGWDFDSTWEQATAFVSADITATKITFVEPFPYEIETGDTYCISGVPFKARCWKLQATDVDRFNRWSMVGTMLKCRKLSGFDGNVNNKWRVSVYRGAKNDLEDIEAYVDVDSNPADSAGAINVDGVDLEPYIEQIAAGVTFELTNAEFNVSWTDSRKVED